MSIEHHPQTSAIFGQETSRLPFPKINLILIEMAAVADLMYMFCSLFVVLMFADDAIHADGPCA